MVLQSAGQQTSGLTYSGILTFTRMLLKNLTFGKRRKSHVSNGSKKKRFQNCVKKLTRFCKSWLTGPFGQMKIIQIGHDLDFLDSAIAPLKTSRPVSMHTCAKLLVIFTSWVFDDDAWFIQTFPKMLTVFVSHKILLQLSKNVIVFQKCLES